MHLYVTVGGYAEHRGWTRVLTFLSSTLPCPVLISQLPHSSFRMVCRGYNTESGGMVSTWQTKLWHCSPGSGYSPVCCDFRAQVRLNLTSFSLSCSRITGGLEVGAEWHLQIRQAPRGIGLVAPSFPGLLEQGAEKSAWPTSVVKLIGVIVVLGSRGMFVNESLKSRLYKVYSLQGGGFLSMLTINSVVDFPIKKETPLSAWPRQLRPK